MSSPAQCSSAEWTQNAQGQDPCSVALDVLSTCNADASVPSLAGANLTSYATPADVGGATACACSVPLYNLLSACSYCQRVVRPSNITWPTLESYSSSCQAASNDLPANVTASLPQWASLSSDVYGRRWSPPLASAVAAGQVAVPTPSSTTRTRPSALPSIYGTPVSSFAMPPPSPTFGPGVVAGAAVGGIVGGLMLGAGVFALVRCLLHKRARQDGEAAEQRGSRRWSTRAAPKPLVTPVLQQLRGDPAALTALGSQPSFPPDAFGSASTVASSPNLPAFADASLPRALQYHSPMHSASSLHYMSSPREPDASAETTTLGSASNEGLRSIFKSPSWDTSRPQPTVRPQGSSSTMHTAPPSSPRKAPSGGALGLHGSSSMEVLASIASSVDRGEARGLPSPSSDLFWTPKSSPLIASRPAPQPLLVTPARFPVHGLAPQSYNAPPFREQRPPHSAPPPSTPAAVQPRMRRAGSAAAALSSERPTSARPASARPPSLGRRLSDTLSRSLRRSQVLDQPAAPLSPLRPSADAPYSPNGGERRVPGPRSALEAWRRRQASDSAPADVLDFSLDDEYARRSGLSYRTRSGSASSWRRRGSGIQRMPASSIWPQTEPEQAPHAAPVHYAARRTLLADVGKYEDFLMLDPAEQQRRLGSPSTSFATLPPDEVDARPSPQLQAISEALSQRANATPAAASATEASPAAAATGATDATTAAAATWASPPGPASPAPGPWATSHASPAAASTHTLSARKSVPAFI